MRAMNFYPPPKRVSPPSVGYCDIFSPPPACIVRIEMEPERIGKIQESVGGSGAILPPVQALVRAVPNQHRAVAEEPSPGGLQEVCGIETGAEQNESVLLGHAQERPAHSLTYLLRMFVSRGDVDVAIAPPETSSDSQHDGFSSKRRRLSLAEGVHHLK